MDYYEMTDIGVYRKENQDASIVLSNRKITFSAICDGMGGHIGGRFASQLSILALKKTFRKWTPTTSKEASQWIKEAIKLANHLMKQHAKNNKSLLDMGTTLSCVFIYQNQSWIFNIGDSRIYIFNELVHKITEDHNLMNYYIKYQGMGIEEAKRLNGASALTSALGPLKDIQVSPYEISNLDNKNVKYFILTTDGIHDYISKALFALILTSDRTTLKEKCEQLIKKAIEGGSRDNLTIVILEYKS